jgi:hypothetical protein
MGIISVCVYPMRFTAIYLVVDRFEGKFTVAWFLTSFRACLWAQDSDMQNLSFQESFHLHSFDDLRGLGVVCNFSIHTLVSTSVNVHPHAPSLPLPQRAERNTGYSVPPRPRQR